MASDQVTQLVLGVGVSTALHPITYAKTLIQLGYEPLPPTTARGVFGGSRPYYPNVFRYVGHIYSVDGFFGIYRGLFPKVLSAAINNAVASTVQRKLGGPKSLTGEADESAGGHQKSLEGGSAEQHSWKCDMSKLCRDTGVEVVSRSAGIIASYPLTVIMVRSMAQFVGRETQYNTILGSLQEILDTEGLAGFYKGLVPRLIGEVIGVCTSNLLIYIVNKYIIGDSKALESTKSYTAVVCSLITSQFTYPFLLVSNVMTVSGSRLKIASVPYKSWIDCLRKLSESNQLKRGSTMFYRAYMGEPLL